MKSKYRINSLSTLFISVTLTVIFLMYPTSNYANTEESLPTQKIYVSFRNDDLSALSNIEHEKKIMEIFERFQVPQTYGIIPNVRNDLSNIEYSKDQPMLNLLNRWHSQGLIEIALHGYTHKDNKLYPQRPSEFRGLLYNEQLKRISKGRDLLERWFDTPVTTFILPFNTHDENTIRAAKEAGIKLVSSSLRSFNDLSNTELYNVPLFIQHTTKLDRFKQALNAARQFIEQNNKSVLIPILYHSWELKSPEDFTRLEGIVRKVSQSEDMVAMTLKDLDIEFSHSIRGAFIIREQAKSEIQKTEKLFSLIGKNSPVRHNKRFIVPDSNYYATKKRQAISLNRNFYFAAVGLAILVVSFYLILLKFKLVKIKLALYFAILAGIICIFLFSTAHFGLFGSDSGIGALDSIMLLFLGVILTGFIFGYFNLRRRLVIK